MDKVIDLPTVQPNRPVVHDIHLSATRDGVTQLRPEDLRPLRLQTPKDFERLVTLYAGLKMPKSHERVFANALLAPDAFFVEAGEIGLIYLTSIIPGFCGQLNVSFWDSKLHRNRQEAVKTVLAEACEKFDLQKINASVPVSNIPLRSFYRKIGFVMEGCLRRMWSSSPPQDMHVLGLLREELEWQLPIRPTISLA
jgi:RimJ/RimL family protein N-acetyltransferase